MTFTLILISFLATRPAQALEDTAGRKVYELAAPLPLTGPLSALRSPWRTVLEKVRSNGTFTPPAELPGFYGLEDHRGNILSDHEADYINLRGAMAPSGKFLPAYVEFISEKWRARSDGGWNVDQWLFETSLDGSVKHVSHRTFREGKDGVVHDIRYDLSSMSDPRIQTTLDALVERWAAKRD